MGRGIVSRVLARAPWSVRWVVGLLAAGLIAAVVVAAVLRFSNLRDQASAEAFERADNAAVNLVAQLDRTLTASDMALSVIRERATDDISMAERANLMVRLHAQVPAVRALVLLDAEGAVVADSTGEIPRGASLAQWGYFRAHRDQAESGLRIDGPVRFDAYREDGVVISRRIVNYDRRFEGVVLGVITADSLRHLLQYARIGGAARIAMLVRDSGEIVARSNTPPNAVLPPLAAGDPLLAAMRADEGRLLAVDQVDGAARQFAFRRIAGQPLAIVVGFDLRSVLTGLEGELWLSIAVVLLLALAILAAAWWVLGALDKAAGLTERLRAGEQRFRDFASATSDWLVETDAQDRITYISERSHDCRDDGRSAVGKRRSDLADPSYDPAGWQRYLDDLAHHRPYRDVVYRRLREDGTAFYLRISGIPVFDARGRFTGYRGTATDVSALIEAEGARRGLEGQLQERQKLESLGTLAGGIAHDFNNSLVPILTLTQMSLKDAPAGSKLQKNLMMVLTAARHSREIVRKILAFSRREEGTMGQIDLRTCVAEAASLARLAVPPHVQVREHYDEHEMPVAADRSQIVQIVTNMMHNAAHAITSAGSERSGQRGEITITVMLSGEEERKRHTLALPAGRVAMLRIADTGCGMDEKTLQRLYEPFFTTKAVGAGTGLGLAMVHGIVTRHSGQIHVESAPGKGTTFTIYFPTSEAAQQAA
jgi:signal transduction histidine kinase